jgi:hypothetical protein
MSNISNTNNTIANTEYTECTGVFCQEIYDAYSYRNNDLGDLTYRIGIMGDYHLFAKNGDKIYMEAKNVGDIVMSFAELQKNRYWKYYYDLSLMLANDKEIKNEAFNNFYDEAYKYDKFDDEYEYSANRVWSLDTAYIDLDIDQNFRHTYKIIPSGNVCYYRINPADLEKLECASPQDIDIFEQTYMRRNELRFGYFRNRNGIYKNLALEYQISKMEKELDELSTLFDDKKQILLNLAILNDKDGMNDNILTIIYNKLTNAEGAVGDKYEYLISKQGNCRCFSSIVQIAQILSA